MAYTLELSDGTTTYNLLDGANTFGAKRDTLNIGVPEAARAIAQSILRTGFDVTAHAYSKRTVSFLMSVTGTSIANLTANVQNITDALRKARAWAMLGVGNKWRLKYNPGGSAKDVYFTIRDGGVSLPPGALNTTNLGATPAIMTNVGVTLTCDPLAEGDSETVENYVDDPGFEVAGTALADWTENKTATGTTARDTSVKKWGKASLKLVMTAGSSGQVIERHQTLPDVDAAEVWSYQVWARIDALSQCKVVFEVDYTGGTPDITAESTAVDGTQFVKLTLANKTAPASTTAAVIRLRLEATGSSPSGTVYIDSVLAVLASAVPETWVSSRNVFNNLDDDDQAGVNNIDIHGVLGDQPAKLQLQLTENENHTKVWAGARHDDRQYDAGIRHEGEDFATWASEPTGDADASDGSYGRIALATDTPDSISTFGDTSSGTSLTFSHTTSGLDRLLLVFVAADDSIENADNTTAVTYNGVPMTRIKDLDNGNVSISVWYLIAPATGSNTVALTFTADFGSVIMSAISFEGIDQTNPIRGNATSVGTGTAVSVAVTTKDNDMVVDGIATDGAPTNTPGSGQTERWDLTQGGTSSAHGSTELASGTSTTMSHTLSGSNVFAQIAVAVLTRRGNVGTPIVLTKSVTTPPQGSYRVLARIRNPDGHAFKVAIGYAYGGVTADPSVSSDYVAIATTQTGWHIVDLGSIVVPPAFLPDGATVGTLTLRFVFYHDDNTVATGINLDLDWILLLPADRGVAYATKTAGTDVVVVDTISSLPSLTLWNTSDVFQSRPEQRGGMILADPAGTRIYMIDDDGTNASVLEGWKVSVKVVPQYLNVG